MFNEREIRWKKRVTFNMIILLIHNNITNEDFPLKKKKKDKNRMILIYSFETAEI